MAASFNKVLLMGNLTRDPELRYIPSGQAVTSFTLAVNRSYLSTTGEKKEEVTFVRIVVWGRRAEVCNEYLKKGSPVFVDGRLQSRSWDAPDGTKRSAIEVIAQNVQFLNRGGKQTDVADEKLGAVAESEAIIDDSFGIPPAAESAMGGPNLSSKSASREPKPDEEVPF